MAKKQTNNEKKKATIANKSNKLKDALLQALEESLGIVTSAVKAVGCNRSTFYDYMEKDPEFKKKVQAIQDIQIDFVEGHLFNQIQEGVPSSTIFYLKTKAKHRGYQESMNLNHTTGEDFPDWFDQSSSGDE